MWKLERETGLTNSHDAQAPDVNFRTILLSCNNFRGHPIRRANHGGPLRTGIPDLRAETKIGCEIISTCYWGGLICTHSV